MNFCEKIENICKRYKKVALFVDMDGTITEYKVYQSGFITNDTKELFLNAEPVNIIIDNLKAVNNIENLDIYILSLSKSKIINEEKKVWLKKYVPFIEEKNYIILVKENGDYNQENRTIVKAQKMKNKLDEYDYVMLLDDEHKILRETQKELQDKGEVFHVSSAII
jgi:5'(3')-deoxyribonucleotidase